VLRFLWIPFGVALFAFVLPFATVSCDESRVSPTGADLVLRTAPETEGQAPPGTRAEEPTLEGFELGELVVAYGGGLATVAFLALAVSLLAAVRGWAPGCAPIAGAVGVAALVFLKTRGAGGRGPEDIAEVDARIGGILAAGAGAVGALAAGAVWLRGDDRPSLRPLTPVVAAALLLFGYLFPSERSPLIVAAYADTLDLRNPWDGAFWLLPVLVGILCLAKRHGISRGFASFSIGVLAVAAADVADEIWNAWREDEVSVGIASIAFLAGLGTAGAWTITDQWKQLRRPALVPLAAGLVLALVAWLASPANS
jgi:hypothetical protein